MALLAEEIVEEWLNRNGYFTIRGAKVGLYEIDLLAIKRTGSKIDRRHIEVQASIRPVSYITPLPKRVQRKTGRAPYNASKRSTVELEAGVQEWVHKKFLMQKKCTLRESLYRGKWQYELVVNEVRHPEELPFIEKEGIKILHLANIIEELRLSKSCIKSAAGRDLVELVMLKTRQSKSPIVSQSDCCERIKMVKSLDRKTTKVGYVNKNRQKNLGRTNPPRAGNDYGQYVCIMRCLKCGKNYGANGSDIFRRKCPFHQGGKPGIKLLADEIKKTT